MAVQTNFVITLTNTGSDDNGPWTVALIKSATTPASGGTAITLPSIASSNTLGTMNPNELVSTAEGFIADTISNDLSTDTNN